MSVAVGRTRPSGRVTVTGDAQVWRYQPPSGCGSRSRAAARGGRSAVMPSSSQAGDPALPLDDALLDGAPVADVLAGHGPDEREAELLRHAGAGRVGRLALDADLLDRLDGEGCVGEGERGRGGEALPGPVDVHP